MSSYWLHAAAYISIFFFILMSAIKVLRYARMPVHLRWELYPVAHEKARDYGGSYYEEIDWWTRPRRKSLYGRLSYMVKEIFLFKQCYHENKGLWYFTYPFHIGLYLFILWLILLSAGGILSLVGFDIGTGDNIWLGAVYYLILTAGIAGLALGTVGCCGLLVKRATDENLKPYTTPVDYINLSFLLAIFFTAIVSWYLYDPTLTGARQLIAGLLALRPVTSPGPIATVSFALFCLFLLYMPFTSMMHGVAKYFMYERVRWDDEPNLKGMHTDEGLLPAGWSATHINSGQQVNGDR
jgi:nitrate reductase gamma subunit